MGINKTKPINNVDRAILFNIDQQPMHATCLDKSFVTIPPNDKLLRRREPRDWSDLVDEEHGAVVVDAGESHPELDFRVVVAVRSSGAHTS